MDIDTLIALVSVVLVVLSNIVVVTYTYGKIVTRLSHTESDIIGLKKSDELHNAELKSIHVIEGQLKTLIEFIKKD